MTTGPSQTHRTETVVTPTAQWLLLGLAFFGLYAYATLVGGGGDTWGVHALAYLHPLARFAGLAFGLALLLPPVQRKVVGGLVSLARPLLGDSIFGRLLPLAVAFLSFFIFYSFPIQTEVYGDTRTILRSWIDNAQLPSLASLFDVRFWKNDAALTQVLLRTMAHTFSISIEQAFRITSALSGALSLCLWTQFVRTTFSESRWGMLLLLVGWTMGANQIFFGHVETYAFVYLTALTFLLSGYLMLERGLSIWLVCLLFLLALKAHAVAICFLPALVVLLASGLGRRFLPVVGLLTWRRVALFLVAPCLAGGAVLYFLYFRSAAAPYTVANSGLPQTFLPLITPHGMRDYSLFSWPHLLDFGNVLLLVGTPVVVVLLGILLLHRRAVDWQHPTVIFASLTLLFPMLFFFAVNPLLSMPRDWDLYALLAAPLLVFLAAVTRHGEAREVPAPAVYGSAMAFCAFSVGFFALNASPARLSQHLEQVGEHVFRTYHTNASYFLVSAQGMEPDTTKSLARRLATIERLAPFADRNDQEYAHLMTTIAAVYRAQGDTVRAVSWAERATIAAPDDLNLALHLTDFLLWANEIDKAEQCVAGILGRDPKQFDALVLAAIIAARKEDYGGALGFLGRAGAVAPGDPDVAFWTANMRAKLAHASASPRRGGP